jgi:hypothetical protein
MVDPVFMFIVFICIAGASYTGWKSGHAAGIEHTLVYLESEGIIEFEPEEG